MAGKKVIFLVDFDNTIFDNVRYKEEAFFPTLSRTSGIPIKEVKALYNTFVAENKYFDISQFVVVLSKKRRQLDGEPVSALDIRGEVLKIKTAQFLDRDAGKTLKTLQQRGNVVIYSQGDFMIQSAKMAKSGILIGLSGDADKSHLSQTPEIMTKRYLDGLRKNLFDHRGMVVIDNRKTEHVGELVRAISSDFDVWVVDDKPEVLEGARRGSREVGLVYVKYGPYANRVPEVKNVRTVERFGWQEAMALSFDRRGLPPLKRS